MLEKVKDYCRETPHGLRGDVGKFQGESPMSIWLYMEGPWDEDSGSVEWDRWFARAGKWIVTEDSFGFWTAQKFDSEEKAKAWFDAENADYCEWIEAVEDGEEDGE